MTGLLWLCAAAFAQLAPDAPDYTVDVERFRPHSDVYGYINTDSSATVRHLQLGVSLWTNYSEDSLVLVWEGERILNGGAEDGDGIIDNRLMSDLQLAMGFSRYFSMSVDIPVILWQEGLDPASADNPNRDTALIATGISDIRLRPKVALLSLDDLPIGLAVVAELGLPTGNGGSFLGEEGLSGGPMGVIEFADGSVRDREYRFRVALNAGYRARNQARFRDVVIESEFFYRAALAIRPHWAIEAGVELNGALAGSRLAHQPLEVLPWVRALPNDLVVVSAGMGFGILPGLGSPDIRAFVGVSIAPDFDPAVLDFDKDGISNKEDQCIREAEDLDDFQDIDGCPEWDNDKDDIWDADDMCPNEAEDLDGWQDDDGCPELDNDKDGILDLADRCPDEPETVNGFRDDDGCPDERPPDDTDGDGYDDPVDRCPYDPEDFDDWEDEDGCPDRDNDMDGILDVDDTCPDEPERYNGFEDADGCPDDDPPQRVFIEQSRIIITEKIYFDVDRTTIKSVSFDLLDEIAALILDHADLRKIRVEGHTDSDGDEFYNFQLSNGRAISVVDALVDRGVDRERLDPAGFGESKPIASNDTEEGKALNRRVEFIIVERD